MIKRIRRERMLASGPASWKFASNALLSEIFKTAEKSDLQPLYEHTDTYPSFPPSTLVTQISKAGGHAIANIFREDPSEEFVGYLEILFDVLGTLNPEALKEHYSLSFRKECIELDKDVVTSQSDLQKWNEILEDLETLVLQSIARRFWDKMTPTQKADFQKTLNKAAAQHGQPPNKVILGAGGTLLLANMGGFGTYMLVSSLLHTFGMGLLGFGAYMTASSVLAIALGPVGWTALAGYAAFHYGRPKMDKLIPIVATIALIRRKNSMKKNV